MKRHKIAHAIQDEHEASFKYIEEVHNCPAVWDISSVVLKDLKQTKENGGASGQTRFRPNLSIPLLLSVFSLLFFCFTVVRDFHCIKSTMLQITVCCDLTRV